MGVLHGNRDRVEPPDPNLVKSRDPLADPIGRPHMACDDATLYLAFPAIGVEAGPWS